MNNIKEGKVSLSKYLFASSGDQLQQAKHFHMEKNKTTLGVSDEYFIALVTFSVLVVV